MLMQLLYSMLITMSIMFMWMKHPMSMGFVLIMQTLIISIISGSMLNNFFFSYIIMIIMLSGALVLFIYMASVASNEKFMMSNTMIVTMLITMLMSLMITTNIKTMEYPKNSMQHYSIMSLTKLFNTISMYTTLMMIIYLLMTMVIVSFIANTQEGPLRMKTYE